MLPGRLPGDMQARVMPRQQPMKMAAAEALYDTAATTCSASAPTARP